MMANISDKESVTSIMFVLRFARAEVGNMINETAEVAITPMMIILRTWDILAKEKSPACTAPSFVSIVIIASDVKEHATFTSGSPFFCLIHPTKPSPPPQKTIRTITCPRIMRLSVSLQKTLTLMLVMQTNAAYKKAVNAKTKASSMLPMDRAG